MNYIGVVGLGKVPFVCEKKPNTCEIGFILPMYVSFGVNRNFANSYWWYVMCDDNISHTGMLSTL